MPKKKWNQLDPGTITLSRLVAHADPTTGKQLKATWAQVVALFTANTPVKSYADIEALLDNTNLVIGYLAFVADAGGDYGDPEITSGWGFYLYNGPDADELSSYTLLASEEGIGGGGGTVTSVTGTTNRITSSGGATPAIDIDAAYDTAITAQINAAIVGLWDDRGTFSAAGGAYPSSGGSGTAGAILKGDIWTISVAGALPTGQVVEIGDTVRALIDTPGNTQANWAILQNNIGYVPVNKTGDTMSGNLAMGTNKVTGLAAASGNGEAVRYEQLILKQDIANTASALTDGGSIAITGAKHTLTTTQSAITFSQSFTGDYTNIDVTFNTTAATWTFPSGSLCVVEGSASGDNTATIAAVSGDKIVISIWFVSSGNYRVVVKNFGQ